MLSVSAAQEAKNPKRDMPIGILVSLLVCTILYMLFAHVMTGVAHYSEFGGQQGIAPVAIAIEHMGEVDASGVLHPDYPWMNKAIVLAILFGYCSVIMVTLLGQSRVFLSMSHDGLLPPFFSHINEKFRTPARSNLLFMVLVGLLAAFVPARLAGEMTSIGTLFCLHPGLCRCACGQKDNARCASRLQDSVGSVRSGCRDHHLPVHDAFPTGRHLDTAGAMDADRAGYLCVLRHQA